MKETDTDHHRWRWIANPIHLIFSPEYAMHLIILPKRLAISQIMDAQCKLDILREVQE